MINKEQTLGLIRHVLTYFGGMATMYGVGVTDDMVSQGVAALMTIIGLVWSWKAPEKKKNA